MFSIGISRLVLRHYTCKRVGNIGFFEILYRFMNTADFVAEIIIITFPIDKQPLWIYNNYSLLISKLIRIMEMIL